MTRETVQKRAKEIDAGLRADDERFNNIVLIQHQDGSSLSFHSAFCIKLGAYRVTFTEHHGFHIYHSDDLHVIYQGAM
jgi:hypothetical protein